MTRDELKARYPKASEIALRHLQQAQAEMTVGSSLALDAQNAIKKGDPIGTYEAYSEWLASHPQGYLYLKQAISALAWQLHKTGNLPMMRKAVDEVIGAERALVDEKK